MELKNYQKQVIDDLEEFLNCLDNASNVSNAFSSYWQAKGVSLPLQNSKYLKAYDNSIKDIPNITLKVPTAGGKTFIASNAISSIFKHYNHLSPQVVTWFVASDTILTQTYNNLSNPLHLYRQKIDSLFNGRVCVVDKERALLGQGISPNELSSQLTIFVLSIQSFASNTKEGRKVYKENEFLAEHTKHFNEERTVEGADNTALINLLAHLNPVCIIDENHNFTSSLRLDVLSEVRPCFILDLTATPKEKSNIISFVNAMELKKNNMVKLPVIVYNKNNKNDVIATAIHFRNNLEKVAKENEQKGGEYIRPIVLFQAESKSNDDNTTFDKIKEQLIQAGIKNEEIKIKVADKDEIKNIDLMSKDCKVRYIITVNALKEGWDCPFAYILASISNRTSEVDVEQILGRILRQPYTKKHSSELLNMSYVFTSSNDFNNTIQKVIEGLENAGFSSKDYRAKDDSKNAIIKEDSTSENISNQQVISFEIDKKEDNLNAKEIKECLANAEIGNNNANENKQTLVQQIEQVVTEAKEKSEEYNNILEQSNDFNIPMEMQQNLYNISDVFKDESDLSLPLFSIKAKNMTFFDDEEDCILLSEEDLSAGFDLSKEDKHIDFTSSSMQAKRLDIVNDNNDTIVKANTLNQVQVNYLKTYLQNLAPKGRMNHLCDKIANSLNRDCISEQQLKDYVLSVLKDKNDDEINEYLEKINEITKIFKVKLDSLLIEHRKKNFFKWITTQRIECNKRFILPKQIVLDRPIKEIPKCLYVGEGQMNTFERDVISEIAGLDNVKWWHRNLEKGRGFCINGFINHYPDFIVRLNSGKTLIIETKGDYLDNTDSKNKIMLGKKWAEIAGKDYSYFMVFENNTLDNSYNLNDLLNLIKDM